MHIQNIVTKIVKLPILFVLLSLVWLSIGNFLIIPLTLQRDIFIQDQVVHFLFDTIFVISSFLILRFAVRIQQNQRRSIEDQLVLEKELFESIFHQLPLVLWRTDKALAITSSSGTGLNFLPYDAHKYLRNLAQPFFDSPDVYEAHQQALLGNAVDTELVFGEHVFDVRVKPLMVEGKIAGCLAVALDVTERLRTEIALKNTLQTLEERVEERTQALNRVNENLKREIHDRMSAQREEQEQRILAETLRDIAIATNRSLDMDEILDFILGNIGRVVDTDAVSIIMIENNHAYMTRTKSKYEDIHPVITRYPIVIETNTYLSQMFKEKEPVIVHNSQETPFAPNDENHQWIKSCVGAPIIINNEVVGFINLGSQYAYDFSQDDSKRLQILVSQVSVAIKNARLYDKARELAIVEERQRIARDLHDAVTQTLFSASVISETLITIAGQKPERIPEGLQQLRHLTRGALAEMRSLLLELRPSALMETDLKDLIRQLSEAFFSRSGLPIQFVADDLPHLPPDVKIAIYRIIQESLNNIVKHARASEIYITIKEQDKILTVTIEDNGRGFDYDRLEQRGRMGIQNMHERAQQIHAKLAINSVLQQGTKIELKWNEIII